MYIRLWLLSARHVSTLLHPHCTPGPSPYIYKRKVQGPRTKKVAARENGLTDRPSLSPSRTLVTPYCKRIRPGRRTTRAVVPLIAPPCVPSRADPSGLGHATTIYSSVQGPPRGRNADKSEEDYSILIPTKPSHLEFEKSFVTEDDMPIMMKLGYFGEAESKLVRLAGEETTPAPKNDEVVVLKSFFRAGPRFPLNDMIGEVLKNFKIYLHQLTPNAIVRLNVFIWALRSQGMSPYVEAFCRVHELHYQTKARANGLHKNFGCYNFAYRKDTKAPVLSYRTKWATSWKNEWFYMKANEKNREKLMTMVMSPLSLNFRMTRPLCNMQLGSPCQLAKVEFRVVAEQISTRDLVQEYLANRAYPTSSGWGMLKMKQTKKKHELVRLAYHFKFENSLKSLAKND
jgi:hypothetical protein